MKPAAGEGYTIYTDSTGRQAYILFSSLVDDSTGLDARVDSLSFDTTSRELIMYFNDNSIPTVTVNLPIVNGERDTTVSVANLQLFSTQPVIVEGDTMGLKVEMSHNGGEFWLMTESTGRIKIRKKGHFAYFDTVDEFNADSLNGQDSTYYLTRLDSVYFDTLTGNAKWFLTNGDSLIFNLDGRYLEAEVDGSTTNELQTISKSGSTVTLSDGGGTFEDTNTQLSEAQVDAFADNNGYLEAEVDGSTTNELQTISKSGSTVTLSNGGGTFEDANTQLSEAQVDAFADNNGYLEAEVDGSTTNELQTISKSGSTVTLSNGGGTFEDTNTQLSEAQVDAFADNNGYLDSKWTTSGNNIYNNNSGNVGIGIIPATKLHVNGSITAEGYIGGKRSLGATPSTNPDNNILFSLRNNDKSTDSRIFDLTTDQNNNAVFRAILTNFNFTGGNVGIATASPTQALHITGNARITGALFDSNNSAGTIGQKLSSTGTGTNWVDDIDNNTTYTSSNGIQLVGTDFQLHLDNLSTESSPVLADYLPIFDVSQNTENKITLSTLKSLIDTDTNTQLSEAQVDAYANNNGYLTSFVEVDGSIVNELQSISKSGSTIFLSGGGGSVTDTDTQLSEATVDSYVSNNGFFSSVGTGLDISGSTINLDFSEFGYDSSLGGSSYFVFEEGGLEKRIDYTTLAGLIDTNTPYSWGIKGTTGGVQAVLDNAEMTFFGDLYSTWTVGILGSSPDVFASLNINEAQLREYINPDHEYSEKSTNQYSVSNDLIYQRTFTFGTVVVDGLESQTLGFTINDLISSKIRADFGTRKMTGNGGIFNEVDNYDLLSWVETSGTDQLRVTNRGGTTATNVYVTIYYTK